MSDATPDAQSGGILANQAAAAESKDQGVLDLPVPIVTEPDAGGTLALEALKVAAYHNDEPDAVTARADTYLDWLKQHG
jgi:hypothetical protein